MNKAKKKYEDFHGKPVKRIGTIKFHEPKALVHLGQAISIVYKCDKKNGGGTGRPEYFEHEFSRGVQLFTDETGNRLFIMGGKLSVKKSGINN